MRIDFLVGDNPYSTTTTFSEAFSKALRRQGVEVRLFYIGGGNFFKAFYTILADPPDLTCSFSDLTIGEKQPLGDAWQIPHLSLLVDHAAYFLHQLKGHTSLISTIDREDLAFLNQLGFDRALFLPHAVDRELASLPPVEPLYDIVMLGSCIDFEKRALSWKRKYPRDHSFLHACAERVLFEGISPLQTLLDAGVEEELPLFHQEIETYVRGRDRIELLRHLDPQKLHIWGSGKWKSYLPDAQIHNSIPFPRALEVMRKAKIVINSIPTLCHGSHERLFHSLVLGALPLTTHTSYLTEEGMRVPTYCHGGWERMRESVECYLEDEEERKAVVGRGKELVLAHHTWDHRATRLLDFLHSLTLSDTSSPYSGACTQGTGSPV